MTRTSTLRLGTALMATASSLCFAAPAFAGEVLFSTDDRVAYHEGGRVNQVGGLTQLRLDSGATVSFVDAVDYRINADGTIDLYAGSVTVAGGDGTTLVRMPEGVQGQVSGAGSAARFSVGPDGKSSGHVLTGRAQIGRNGNLRSFAAGDMFEIAPGGSPRQVVSNGAQATPGTRGDEPEVLAMGGEAGPVAAARNGLPVTLGDALAAAGASGDILGAARRVEAAVGNPAIETFPVGDLQLLVAAAARLEGAYGGTPFTGAQADIIRTYLQFLATGGAGDNFLTAYVGFLTQYLNLIRSGAAPSTFGLANLDQIDSFIAFTDRTGGFGSLPAQDRALVEAYLAFIRAGGDADAFGPSFTDLTAAYFAFIRAGGNPADFADASQATIDAYIAFLADSGLLQQLSDADRALVAAYLANGGLAFATEYQAALDAYFAFLASGRLPSDYAGLDPAVLQVYLATLEEAGLLETVLGGQAAFYADYLAFLEAGGNADAFAGLPANIFAGYADALNAYFAYLAAGGLPSAYGDADIAVLNDYLAQIAAVGALDRFLGEQSGFFADYLAFLQGGGEVDAFAGLNANIFAGYAQALNAYYEYLANGGVPSAYGALTQETIADYLAALEAAGATSAFLAELADFYSAYFAFVAGGGNPDNFANLPVPPDFPAFAAALNAYATFLANGGLPADYDAEDLAVLQNYLDAIVGSGQLADLLGANADLLTGYFAFLAAGGDPNGFSGLPLYADYVAALNAYYAFLANGGLPADYGALDQATIEAYLAALDAAGGFAAYANLNAFFAEYFAFVSGGGDPAEFAGLPIYQNYLAAIQAYYQFLIAGGLPSDYADLDLATIEAYLAALADANILGGSLDAAIAAFLTDYLAFVQGGGDPDQFAGLPGNGGGPLPAFDYPYQGGFPANADVRIAAASGFTTASRGDIESYSVGADGELLSARRTGFGNTWLGASADLHKETYGDESALIGRYSGGDAQMNFATVSIPENGGVHYLLLAPSANPIPTPQTELTVDYDLLAATNPTYLDGHTAPGSFAGDLRIVYASSQLQAGLWGTITMPEASGDTVYNFDTRDFTGALTSFGAPGPNDDAITLISRISDVGDACTTGDRDDCRVRFDLYFGGATRGDRVGTVYNTSQVGSDQVISGAALFGAPTPLGGGSGGTGTPYSGTVTGLEVLTTRFGLPSSTLSNYSNSTVTFDADGLIDTYTNSVGSTAGSGLDPADPDEEAGSIEGAIAWARFLDPNNNQGQVEDTGVHVIVGAPAVDLPTTGLVNYALIGGTRPTTNEGTEPAGSFSGDLAIDFAAQKVGIDFDIYIAEYGWNMATAGGAADPSNGGMDIRAIGQHFFRNGFALTPLTAASCTGTCTGDILGNLYGQGASHAGVVYRVVDGSFAARGSAVFAAPGAAGTPVDSIGTLPMDGGSGGATGGLAGATDTFDASGLVFAVGGALDEFDGTITLADGVIQSYTGGGANFSDKDLSTGTLADSGTASDIAWARWQNPQSIFGGFYDNFHVFGGTELTNLPTSGRIDFEQIGGTAITDGAGNEGTLTGDLSVLFGGAAPLVGIEVAIDISGRQYSAQSTGGVADPGQSQLFINGNSQFAGDLTATPSGGAVCTNRCNVNVFGQGFGDGLQQIGVGVSLNDNFNYTAEGLMIFGQSAAPSGGGGGAGASATAAAAAPIPAGTVIATGDGVPLPPVTPGGSGGVGQGTAFAGVGSVPTGIDPGMPSPPPSPSIAAGAFDGMWARFAAPSVTSPGNPAAAGPATERVAVPVHSREQAEALLGGMITFNPR